MAIDPNWVRESPEEAARQMDALSEERELYRAAEEAQIALRKKAVEREQALAANIGRLRVALEYASDYLNEGRLNSIGHGSKAHREMDSALAQARSEK